MLSKTLFVVSALSGLSIIVISFISWITDKFQFWPPPGRNTWQYRALLTLFRCMVYPLIVMTVLEFHPIEGLRGIVQYSIGCVFLVVGFGAAFWGTSYLGWKNAYGEKEGLKTTGWYAWSRNPIYVVTFVGLLGWTMIANSLPVTIVLAIWAVLYLLAPFLEEPWLAREYGEDYRQYKAKVRRFI